jgi:hypothetical protein
MADQDAQDITQMNTSTPEIPVAAGKPRKSYLLWIVLGCVVVGVGLGVFVYQRSLAPVAKPSPTPKTAVATPKPTVSPVASPLASPVTPNVSVVNAQPKTVAFPKAGKLRVYYQNGGWSPLGIILKDASGEETFQIPSGQPSGAMKILDTGYELLGPTTVTIDTYLGSNSSQLSVGWATPASNKCGFNGYGVVDIASYVSYATAQANGEPLVSVQCWGDYSPDATDPSSKDFNDYTLVWSYTPSGSSASPSPSGSASASSSPTASPSVSPSPSVAAAASPTPTPSTRAAMPDTSDGVPVTGVFEVTVGTVSIGLVLLLLGLFGLLVL